MQTDRDFYPRPPRGGRQYGLLAITGKMSDFYPRPPRGGRPASARFRSAMTVFLSTPSARRATEVKYIDAHLDDISIHALREEGDARMRSTSWRNTYFYPRPPRGGRLQIRRLLGQRFRLFLSPPSARRATAKTERKHPAFVSLYTSLHKLQRDVCKPNRKITPLLAQTAGIPVRSVPENHVCCRFALAGHQKISTLSWANSGCSPTCSTLVW